MTSNRFAPPAEDPRKVSYAATHVSLPPISPNHQHKELTIRRQTRPRITPAPRRRYTTILTNRLLRQRHLHIRVRLDLIGVVGPGPRRVPLKAVAVGEAGDVRALAAGGARGGGAPFVSGEGEGAAADAAVLAALGDFALVDRGGGGGRGEGVDQREDGEEGGDVEDVHDGRVLYLPIPGK